MSTTGHIESEGDQKSSLIHRSWIVTFLKVPLVVGFTLHGISANFSLGEQKQQLYLPYCPWLSELAGRGWVMLEVINDKQRRTLMATKHQSNMWQHCGSEVSTAAMGSSVWIWVSTLSTTDPVRVKGISEERSPVMDLQHVLLAQ